MSGYTVTITQSGAKAGPQTTIHVDTTTGAARVVELTMRAADGNGLAPQEVPAIDLAGLIAALAPGGTAAVTGIKSVAPEGGTRGRRSSASAAKAAKAAAKTAAKRGAGRGRRRAEAAADAGEATTGRAYRRMPDQDEVVAAWRQSGSTSAVAEHFGVPRHTATGWLRRLRGLGLLEPAS
jgi:hypothetical protein